MLSILPGKFVMHFDYIINDCNTVKLSLSNLYKEFKVSRKFIVIF